MTDFIRQPISDLEAHLEPDSLIADIGSFNGEAGLYLAQKGYTTYSVDILHEPLADGLIGARDLGPLAAKAFFVQGSAVDLMFPDAQFDAVVSTIALQQVPRDVLPKAIEEMMRITKPGGFNAIRVYAGTPDEIAVKPNYSIFEFGELEHVYGAVKWQTVLHREKHLPLQTDDQGKTWVSSFSEIIARKPLKDDSARRSLIAQAEYYRRSDPELYDYFMQQAEAS